MMQKSYKPEYTAMTDSTLVMQICAGLKQMRLNENISQEELAVKSGIDRTTISRIERGRAGTLLSLVQILRALDRLDILDVFKEEPELSPLKLLKIQERSRKKASPKERNNRSKIK